MPTVSKKSPTRPCHRLVVLSILAWATMVIPKEVAAEERSEEESDIRFAFYSAAWGENADEAIRLVAFNNTENRVRLRTINFQRQREDESSVNITVNLEIPAQRYAEVMLPYLDLLSGDDCVDRTMGENWKLVEISNYTLNPSVRNLIIEDTNSFRIYQCEQSVQTSWVNLQSDQEHQYNEWVLYHFETRPAL